MPSSTLYNAVKKQDVLSEPDEHARVAHKLQRLFGDPDHGPTNRVLVLHGRRETGGTAKDAPVSAKTPSFSADTSY